MHANRTPHLAARLVSGSIVSRGFVVAARVVLRRAKQAVKRSQWHILATLREVDTAAGGVQALVQALHRDAVDFNELGSLDSALAFPHDGW